MTDRELSSDRLLFGWVVLFALYLLLWSSAHLRLLWFTCGLRVLWFMARDAW